MTDVNPPAVLHTALNFAYKNLVNDLSALSEEQAATGTAAGTRSAVSVVTECALINGLVAGFIATSTFTPPSPEERAAYFAAITTRAQALSALESRTQLLRDAIDARDPATWADPYDDVFGTPNTVLGIANIAPLHMMYHDGQINYMHTLHGDLEMHW